MRKCNKCGYDNPDFINVCLECGEALPEFIKEKYSDENISNDTLINDNSSYKNITDDCDCGTNHTVIEDNCDCESEHVIVEDDCECGIDHGTYIEKMVNKKEYKDNYYIDNVMDKETLPYNFNGHKSYYSYLQSLKSQVKPFEKLHLIKLNKTNSLIILALMIIAVLLITPVIGQEQYSSIERSQFNSYSTAALNNELATNQILTQVAYSGTSAEENVEILTNLSTSLDSSISSLETMEKFTFNDTRHHFLELQIEALEIDKKNVDMYRDLSQLESDFMNDKITSSELETRLNELSNPDDDLERMESIHKQMYDIIDKDPIIKSDFNNLRTTPIYQALANDVNATANNTTTNNTTVGNTTN